MWKNPRPHFIVWEKFLIPVCDSQSLQLIFHQTKSGLTREKTSTIFCLFCNKFLHVRFVSKHSHSPHVKFYFFTQTQYGCHASLKATAVPVLG